MIRQLKGLYSAASLKKAGWSVPAPGGNEWSQDADAWVGMDQYVHLCFCNSHPMEFLARQSGRIQTSIFLEIDPAILTADGVLFTAGVSNKAGMARHTIEEAKQLIDFDVICTRMDWRDPAILQRRKDAEKCEILVPDGFDIKWIRNMPNG